MLKFQLTGSFVKKCFLLFSILCISVICGQSKEAGNTMFYGDEQQPAIQSPKNDPVSLQLKWKFKTQGKIFSSPTVHNQVVYIGSEDKNLYAIDVKTGKLKWTFTTGGAVHSSPAVSGNVVYFGSYDGYYYAVNATSGKLKWKFKTLGEKHVGSKGLWTMLPLNDYMEDLFDFFLSSPVIDKDEKHPTVYFGSSDGYLYAVDANTGVLKWKFKTNGIVHTTPAIKDGTVYIGSWDTFLYAIDAKTGKEKWKFKTGEQPVYHILEGIQSSPVIYDSLVLFGSRDGYFYGVNAKNGSLAWKYSAENSWVLTTAAVKDNVVYIGTSDTYLLIALDGKDGKEKFRFREASGYIYSSCSIDGNTGYFGDFTGKLYAVDLSSKGEKWSEYSTDSHKQNAPGILKDGRLDFAYAGPGVDLAQYSGNATVMNKLYTMGAIVSTPAISNGTVYFGSADGYLYALNVP